MKKSIIVHREAYNSNDIDSINNRLFFGDNLEAMEYLIENNYSRKIDMIYIDPPFLSQAKYSHRIQIGDIRLDRPGYEDNWGGGLEEYLDMLRPRLLLMKNLLSDTGIICFHADWHAIHYVKVMLDQIFGYDNFVNEVIWTYTGGTDRAKGFARKHDTILIYSKTGNFKFNPVYVDFTEATKKRFNKTDENGRKYKINRLSDGRITRTYMKEQGKLCPDYWHFNILVASHSESTGYRTQKPRIILERLIKAFSDKDDLIADFFAGSGTTLQVANELDRRWIGAENGIVAKQTLRLRLIKSNASFSIDYLSGETIAHRKIQNNIASLFEPYSKLKEANKATIIFSDQNTSIEVSIARQGIGVLVKFDGFNYKECPESLSEESLLKLNQIIEENYMNQIRLWAFGNKENGNFIFSQMYYMKHKNRGQFESAETSIAIESLPEAPALYIEDIFGFEYLLDMSEAVNL